jgi:hypothetical protein
MLEYACGQALKTLEEARDKGGKNGNALSPNYAERFTTNTEMVLSQTIALASALDRNRFWLGTKLYRNLNELTQGWPSLVGACLNDDAHWPELARRVGEVRKNAYRLRDELELAEPDAR